MTNSFSSSPLSRPSLRKIARLPVMCPGPQVQQTLLYATPKVNSLKGYGKILPNLREHAYRDFFAKTRQRSAPDPEVFQEKLDSFSAGTEAFGRNRVLGNIREVTLRHTLPPEKGSRILRKPIKDEAAIRAHTATAHLMSLAVQKDLAVGKNLAFEHFDDMVDDLEAYCKKWDPSSAPGDGLAHRRSLEIVRLYHYVYEQSHAYHVTLSPDERKTLVRQIVLSEAFHQAGVTHEKSYFSQVDTALAKKITEESAS